MGSRKLAQFLWFYFDGFNLSSDSLRNNRTRLSEKTKNLISQNSQQFQQALDLYLQWPDKAWSLTDCSSFLIMGELNLTEALAHDKYFKQAGFITLLGESI